MALPGGKLGSRSIDGSTHCCPRRDRTADDHTVSVDLSKAEQTQLAALLNGGKHAARKIKRARILPAADAGVRDAVIANSIAVGASTVYCTKPRFEANLGLALSEEPQPTPTRGQVDNEFRTNE